MNNQINSGSLLIEFYDLNQKNWKSISRAIHLNPDDLRREDELKSLLLSGVTEIEFTTNKNWDWIGKTKKVKSFDIVENILWFDDNSLIAIDGFLRNIYTGRYKDVSR